MNVILLLSLLHFSIQTPLILDQNTKQCRYEFLRGPIFLTSKLWILHANEKDIQVSFTLCGKLINQNDLSAVLQVGRKKNISLGSEFAVDNETEMILKTRNGMTCRSDKNYTLFIKFTCDISLMNTPLLLPLKDDCTFDVVMLDSSCNLPKCTLRYMDNIIDLTPLKGTYHVPGKGHNFSLALCHTNIDCKQSGLSMCDINGNEIQPLATLDSQIVQYNKEKQEISIVGNVWRNNHQKIDKKVTIVLKCNWSSTRPVITYPEIPTQGRQYRFIMETTFGCIKRSESCQVTDHYLLYDLNKIQSPRGWIVRNSKNDIYLNVCGVLEMDASNNCTDFFSRSCEVDKNIGNYINRGSVLSHITLDGDILKATIHSGAQCNINSSRLYNTYIDFYCSKVEYGPDFVKQENCDTHIIWKTPKACPMHDVTRCKNFESDFYNCTFIKNGYFYNLSSLNLHNAHYKISNGSQEFLLNVCGPIFDTDVPCMRDVSIAMKDLKQENVKYRVISLGKMVDFDVNNGNIVLEFAGGTFVNGNEYKSNIKFECSENENITVTRQDSSTFSFKWRTNAACPKKIYSVNKTKECIITDKYDKMYNFSGSHITAFNISHNSILYTFDICQQDFTLCGKDCSKISFKNKTVLTVNNITYVDMTLSNICNSKYKFKKISIILRCGVSLNEYFSTPHLSDCILTLEYISHRACGGHHSNDKKNSPTNGDVQTGVMNYETSSAIVDSANVSQNCTIRSIYTDYEFPLSKLNLSNKFNVYTCPNITFNYHNNSVTLIYWTNSSCKLSGKIRPYYHEVVLICSSEDLLPNSLIGLCGQQLRFQQKEYCNLFVQSWSIWGILLPILLVIAAVFILIIVGVAIRFRRGIQLGTIYYKHGDL